ncbi:MAG: nickel pincer cofactor biosynthesis protein LarB [Omnitrophica WOR_2 bacterium]
MDIEKLRQLLSDVQSGTLDVDLALDRLRLLPYEDLGFAQLDNHRALRKGIPEVVFCQNKTVEQVLIIFTRLSQHQDRVLGTRASTEMAKAIQAGLPGVHYDPMSRLLTFSKAPQEKPQSGPYTVVVSGGTADMPVAEEAVQTLEFLGDCVERAYDVGVAGIHRLLDKQELLMGATVIISVAGMEGALTSVVGGLVSCPVIGVPTSVGYGAHFEGLTPLLSMLDTCAPGVAVVNIDNGFGAAVFTHSILLQMNKNSQP